MHNIQLTSEQYRTLLELVHMGDWVATAHKVESIEKYDQLYSYLFSLSKKFNLKNVSLEDEPQYPTAEFEENLMSEYIEEYDELTFWDQLSEMLMHKLFKEKYTQEQINEMDRETRFNILCQISDKVASHLQIHGINQIVIK